MYIYLKEKCNIPAAIISMFSCHKHVNVVLGVLFACMQCPFKVKRVAKRAFGPEDDAVCYAQRMEDHLGRLLKSQLWFSQFLSTKPVSVLKMQH